MCSEKINLKLLEASLNDVYENQLLIKALF